MSNKTVVLIVGAFSTLANGIATTFAENKASIILVDWSDRAHKQSSDNLISSLKNSGASNAIFISGKLNDAREWKRIISEVREKFSQLHHLIYLDGLDCDVNYFNESGDTIKKLAVNNVYAPIFAISSALEILSSNNGQVAVVVKRNFGKSANTALYTSQKEGLRGYLQAVHKSTGIQITYIYPGVSEYYQYSKGNQLTTPDSSSKDCYNRIYSSLIKKEELCILETRENKVSDNNVHQEYIFEPPLESVTPSALSAAILDVTKLHDVKEVLKSIKKNPDMVSTPDEHGRNAIHYAAYAGNLAALELLLPKLRKKSQINSEDRYKWTPLHFAAMRGNLRMVKRLLKENADPNILTQNHLSPLHFLARCIPVDPKPEVCLLQAFKILIECGADTNQKNYEWATPLHEAARSGSYVAIDFFLKNEGDPHRRTRTGATPLQCAIKPGNDKVIKLLLDAGADPIGCFELATNYESILNLLEPYRERNRRPESDSLGREKEIIIISGMEELLPMIDKQFRISEYFSDTSVITQNWDVFLYVLRFLTRKVYKFPGALEVEKKREVVSRAAHNLSLEEASEKFISNGNPRKMYKTLEEAGKGGFGSVVVAKKLDDKKRVAVKRVPHFTKKEKWNNLDEICFLQASAHNCVVKYYNSFISRDELWMIMEYMEGGSLAQVVSKWNLTEGQICFVTREILKGLRSMHENRLVHRDLKSANVMLSIYGDIKIIDFGLCIHIDSGADSTNMVGSPFWIPPEMIQRKQHGPPADIWSLAILCLEMANGAPPYRESALKAMLYAGSGIAPKLKDPSKWSSEFIAFLGRMLQIDPNDRAQASELLKDPWMEHADSKKSMREILHQVFVEKSLENSLGISI